MAEFNDWDDDLDDTLGDILKDKLEDDAKDSAKDVGKEVGKAGLHGLDKLTDKINPIKKIKDKAKGFVNGVKQLKKKIKDKAKQLAKDGIKAVGRAIVHAMKGIFSWIVAHPIPSLIILIVLIIIINATDIDLSMESETTGSTGNQTENASGFDTADGLSDDDVVVVLMEDCLNKELPQSMAGEAGSSDKEETAKRIYSVFHSYGFTNASIAGILGNIETESGLDPTCIEGIYDEYGYIGKRKTKAFANIDNHVKNTLFPDYAGKGIPINKAGYKADDGKYYCGLGVIQWTGGGAKTFMAAAETVGMKWYTIDFQLAYMLSDTLYRQGFFTGWVNSQETTDDLETAKRAAVKFAHDYEGNSWNDSVREGNAETWWNIMGGWGDAETDQTFVDSITDTATQLGGLIEFADIAKTTENCGMVTSVNNSSLANAAVSFSWPTKAESFNNGTNLYQAVVKGCLNNTYFKACDRVVAGAVRWSGTDDDFPMQTSVQLNYMQSSPKWELVGMSNALTVDQLQPGDVFSLDGHIMLYVGEEAVQAAHGDKAEAGSDSVSGSLDERSASCNNDCSRLITQNGGMDWSGRGAYYVFRCTTPDNSETYKDVGAGM